MSEELLLGKVLYTYSTAQSPYSHRETEFYLVVEENSTHLFIVPIGGRNSEVDKSKCPVIPSATLEALKAYYQPLIVNRIEDKNQQFRDPEGRVFNLYKGEQFHPLS